MASDVCVLRFKISLFETSGQTSDARKCRSFKKYLLMQASVLLNLD